METVEIDFEDKTCTLIDLTLGRKKYIVIIDTLGLCFCLAGPSQRVIHAVANQRQLVHQEMLLSLCSGYQSEAFDSVNNTRQDIFCCAVNCRIVFRKIVMQPRKDLWNTGSIAPSTKVILKFQSFVDGRLLCYWETSHNDYSNASKTIEPPEQGAESTV